MPAGQNNSFTIGPRNWGDNHRPTSQAGAPHPAPCVVDVTVTRWLSDVLMSFTASPRVVSGSRACYPPATVSHVAHHNIMWCKAPAHPHI